MQIHKTGYIIVSQPVDNLVEFIEPTQLCCCWLPIDAWRRDKVAPTITPEDVGGLKSVLGDAC